MAAHRGNNRSVKTKDKGEKLVAIIGPSSVVKNKKVQPLSPPPSPPQSPPLSPVPVSPLVQYPGSPVAAATTATRETAVVTVSDVKKKKRKERYYRISQETWQANYELVQEQKRATQKTAELLQLCIARIKQSGHYEPQTVTKPDAFDFTTTKTVETGTIVPNAHNPKDLKTVEREERSETTAVTAPEDISARLLQQLCWWRELSPEEEVRVANLPSEYKLPVADAKRFLLRAREEQSQLKQQTTNYDQPMLDEPRTSGGKKSVATKISNKQLTVVTKHKGPEKKETISDQQKSPTTIDMKGLYRSAFDVRRHQMREQRQRRVVAAKRIQQWWWRQRLSSLYRQQQQQRMQVKEANLSTGTISGMPKTTPKPEEDKEESLKEHKETQLSCTTTTDLKEVQNDARGSMMMATFKTVSCVLFIGLLLFTIAVLFFVDGIVSIQTRNPRLGDEQ
mgnify:CR=1 FL=1